MAFPVVNSASPSRRHMPQLNDDGICTKMIKPTKSGSQERCGQGIHGHRHLYYPCRRNRRCREKFYSIESRIDHEAEKHR